MDKKEHKKLITKHLGTKLTKKLRQPAPEGNSNKGKIGNQVGRQPKAFCDKRHKKIFYLNGPNFVLIDGLVEKSKEEKSQSDILNDILIEWLEHKISNKP